MRKFFSYGPIDTDLHYYAPRQALIERTLSQLVGEDPNKSGHYITVWGPRQAGKTWVMQQVFLRLQAQPYADQFDIVVIPLEHLKMQPDVNLIVQSIATEIVETLALKSVRVTRPDEFHNLFRKGILKKPLILILDEFDALAEDAISGIVGIFRNIYIRRRYQGNVPTAEKDYLLHGVALVGVRAVLGVENVSGSPFNVQRSLHIPNLTYSEVQKMFEWYESARGQAVEGAVVERLFYETQGQPGLVCWLGELLTETYNGTPDQPLTMANFEGAYAAALDVLPNNNILNIISKAAQAPYQQFILDLFRTDETVRFRYDQREMNYLYLNGVIDLAQISPTTYEVKFSCPFVQKRLFNYFATDLFHEMDRLYDPFEDLVDTITDDALHIENLLRRYEKYLQQNREWLFKEAPRRRTDLRLYEAVYHFNLYMYLSRFLQRRGGQVHPEFPTGNGKIDLIIAYAGQRYGLEIKSFTGHYGYREALTQAAKYGQTLQVSEIPLVFFVEGIDEANRNTYEVDHVDALTGVTVKPIFVQTGA